VCCLSITNIHSFLPNNILAYYDASVAVVN
jgi:hypothetical protein